MTRFAPFLFALALALHGAACHAQSPREGGDPIAVGDKLGADDEARLGKLFERLADAREKKQADEIMAKADGKMGQAVAAGFLAGAIVYVIHHVLVGLVDDVLWRFVESHWCYFVGGWLAFVAAPAWFIGGLAARRAVRK